MTTITLAPICDRCRRPLDDGQHVKANGWHCQAQLRIGGLSLVTTPGAAEYPARCGKAVAGITDRGCTLAYGHTEGCA